MLIANFQRYYTLSVILGTVALSYGSVPMYKMVSLSGIGKYRASLMRRARSANKLVGVANRLKLPSIRTLMIPPLDSRR